MTFTIPGYLLIALVNSVVVIFVLTATHSDPDDTEFDFTGALTLTAFNGLAALIFASAVRDATRGDVAIVTVLATAFSLLCLWRRWLRYARVAGAVITCVSLLGALSALIR